MKTRYEIQTELFFLVLNGFGKADDVEVVAVATNEDTLKDWYESQKLGERERDGRWVYTFKDGPIRFKNPLHDWRNVNDDIFGRGWFSAWVNLSNLRSDIYRVDF